MNEPNTFAEYLQKNTEQQRQTGIEICKETFSERLQELRKEKNYSQKTVAKKLGVAISTYANWEQGRTEPSIYDIFNLMWVFNIDANDLFNIELFGQTIPKKNAPQ